MGRYAGLHVACGAIVVGVGSSAAVANWIEFVDETATRLIADPVVGASDNQERDYAWADLNNNGWIDLVVMRKQPFTTAGQQRNVLFMNEGGVLVDRSLEYASATNLPPDIVDHGFLTPTNDRAAAIADIDNNGWKDIITAVTISDGWPKHVSHPRIYKNQGEDSKGAWLGFVYEEDRIPQLGGFVQSGPFAGFPHAPRFCAVGAGDITGNGFADLYFGDYDSGAFGSPQTLDFNDRLLINDETGYFSDESFRVASNELNSAFTTAVLIDDFNQNGVNDIIRVNSLGAYNVRKFYNNPNNEGTFQSYQMVVGASPYFAAKGDLNNNGRLDLVVVRDGQDVVILNQGTNASTGQVVWGHFHNLSNSNGFRSNTVIADLNNDGWADILIANLDVDENNCVGFQQGHGHIYRNNQNAPNVTFTHDYGNIPQSAVQHTFDWAVFDITGNGWLDVVVATGCNNPATRVWINQPTFGINFAYPAGQPVTIEPETATELTIELSAFGQDLAAETAQIHVSVNGGPFVATSMTPLNQDNLFTAMLPATECGSIVQYYVSAELVSGFLVTDPVGVPGNAYTTISAIGMDIAFADDIEGDVSDWTIFSDPTLISGEWEQVHPNGILCCGNQLANPDSDASPSGTGMAFVTQNCADGQLPGQCQVGGGATYLVSPVINLEGSNAIISYDRWVFCSQAGNPSREAFLETEISNDGGKTWAFVHKTSSTGSQWQNVSFLVSDYVVPTGQIQVRFVVDDTLNQAITNAGIDNLIVDEFLCDESTPCPADLNGSGAVDVFDLLALLSAWGTCPDCPADLNGDGTVDVFDLLALLSAWGPCP